ncbi:unnamed protein product [Paramecium primaurelia]|uniref:Uncharacterized protein n=1 Tax=Paramecium primaurelia TaxID=5886 RepID=A0A8S1QND3_PARPR|nr:unnamed protein product [Paramecium primaurelia]
MYFSLQEKIKDKKYLICASDSQGDSKDLYQLSSRSLSRENLEELAEIVSLCSIYTQIASGSQRTIREGSQRIRTQTRGLMQEEAERVAGDGIYYLWQLK